MHWPIRVCCEGHRRRVRPFLEMLDKQLQDFQASMLGARQIAHATVERVVTKVRESSVSDYVRDRFGFGGR